MMPVYFWDVSGERIFVGNSMRGYEIRIFDLDGNFIRKIRKNDRRVKFPQEILDEFKSLTSRSNSRYVGIRRTFPEYQPAFQRLCFTDAEARLYVMTFEKAKIAGGYWFDIFNSEGILVGRIALDAYVERFTQNFPLYATAKKKRFYCLREKRSGYKELVVSKMTWQ